MSNYPGTINYREITPPILAVLVLFMASIHLPLAGIFLGIFTPLPVVYIYLKRGWVNAAAVLVITFLVLFNISGGLFAVFYFMEYGVLAVVMAEMIHRCYLSEKVVLLSALAPLFCGLLAVNVFFNGQDISLVDFLKEKVDFILQETIKSYRETGVSGEHVETLEMYSGELAKLFIRMTPAWLISGSIMTALFNYSAIRRIWIKWFGAEYPCFKEPSFSKWALSDYFIWAFIASGILLLAPVEALNIIGINFLFLSVLTYIIQGLAIIFFWLEQKGPYQLWGFLGLFLVLLQPIFLLVIAGVGIFDIWLDFRRIRVSASLGEKD